MLLALSSAAAVPAPPVASHSAASTSDATATPSTAAAPSTADTPSATATPSAAVPIPAVTIPPALANCKDPMCYAGDHLSINAKSNSIVLSDFEAVDTTRGLAYIRADKLSASGIGQGKQAAALGNSRWNLSGHVLAQMKQGRLEADSATVQLAHNGIASIVAVGQPARFEHLAVPGAVSTGKSKPLGFDVNVNVHGHADSITYDVASGRVQLQGDSWLSDGCNEITSPRITYDTSTQDVQAGAIPGNGGRVHGTLRTTRPGTSCTAGLARR